MLAVTSRGRPNLCETCSPSPSGRLLTIGALRSRSLLWLFAVVAVLLQCCGVVAVLLQCCGVVAVLRCAVLCCVLLYCGVVAVCCVVLCCAVFCCIAVLQRRGDGRFFSITFNQSRTRSCHRRRRSTSTSTSLSLLCGSCMLSFMCCDWGLPTN
mgnify:CR=1 FL=1